MDSPTTAPSLRNIPPSSLACDGLWDVMEDQEAVTFVMNRLDEKNLVAEHLVREALRRGSTDNITVQVAWL